MTLHRSALPLVLAAVALAPFDARAQGLSANELWLSWQASVGMAGGTLSATESREGNRIVLKDLVLDSATLGRVSIPEVVLVSQADGSVGVLLPEKFPLHLRQPDPEAEPDADPSVAARTPSTVMLNVAAPGMTISVLGLGDLMDFQVRAPAISVLLDRIDPPPASVKERLDLSLALADLDLHFQNDMVSPTRKLDSALSLGTLHAEAQGINTRGDDFHLVLDTAAINAKLAWALPAKALELMQPADSQAVPPPSLRAFLDLLDQGLMLDSRITLGPSLLTAKGKDPNGGPMDAGFTLEKAELNAALSQAALDLGAALLDFQIKNMPGDTPDDPPQELGVQEYRVALGLDLAGMKGPRGWRAAYVLRDMHMTDFFWREIDPTKALPRDPLTLAVDLAGEYTLPPEMLEPGWQLPESKQVPFSKLTLKSNELAVQGLGVTASGETDMTLSFDPTEGAAYPLLPTGRMMVKAQGVYGLIDRLSALGQLSDAELQGLRLGLMALAKAGEEPDSLVSDLDFRDGSLYVNGQKIR